MTKNLRILSSKHKSNGKMTLLKQNNANIRHGRENVIKHIMSGGPKKSGKSTPKKSRNGLRRPKQKKSKW
jgi:hypothetical protein